MILGNKSGNSKNPNEASKESWSCEYLEGGLTFYDSSIRACAIHHHGTGEPCLMEYNGGEVCISEVLEAKRAIIAQNQTKERHPNCRECPYLVKRQWHRSKYSVNWLGISSWLGCNLKCNYCWLEWSEWSPRRGENKKPLMPYDVNDSVSQLLDGKYLAPDAVIDWGGGGEPSLMPGFEEMLVRLSEHGTTQWLHTNATRLPSCIRDKTIDGTRISLLCSVDAGSRKGYQEVKGVDLYEVVWQNLEAYSSAGATVNVKYIMQPINCSRQELRGFIEKVILHGKPTIIGDFDFRLAEPTTEILEGLAYLQLLAHKHGLNYSLGGVGVNSVAREELKNRIEGCFPAVYYDPYLYPSKIFLKMLGFWYRLSIMLDLFVSKMRKSFPLLKHNNK